MRNKVVKKLRKEVAIALFVGDGVTKEEILKNKKEAAKLAWKDGFRHEGAAKQGIDNFIMMLRWWRQTHQLPFIGDIIYWKPKKTNA